MQYKAELVAAFESSILPEFTSGVLKPIIETSFSLSDIGKAHALMESNTTIGKILINVSDSERPCSNDKL